VSAFILELVENCFKEENEEEFIQFSTECNPCDGRESSNPLQSETPHSSEMAKCFHLKMLLSSDSVKANGHAVALDGDHSVRHSIEQGTTRSLNEERVVDEVVDLTNDSEGHVLDQIVDFVSHFFHSEPNEETIVVKKHNLVGDSTTRGSSRTENGENTPRSIPEMCHSTVVDDILKCTICSKRFYTENFLKRHMEKMHTIENEHRCTMCDKRFRTRINFAKHMKKFHAGKKPYACSFCDKKLRSQCGLKMHELRHKGELPQCSVCGGRYTKLDAHMRSTHFPKDYKYVCSVCNRGFSVKFHLKRHMLTHSEEKPYACQDCGGQFRTFSNLKIHMATHTRGQEKNHVCVICEKKYSTPDYLNIHMRTHTGEKPHRCETCGRTFKAPSTLHVHRTTHSSEKRFVCATCGKGFRLPATLHRHELIHSGVQPYECSVCGLRFNQSSSMHRHILTHTGEKPYSCTDCGQRFTQSGGLASHRRRHCKAKKTDVATSDALGDTESDSLGLEASLPIGMETGTDSAQV